LHLNAKAVLVKQYAIRTTKVKVEARLKIRKHKEVSGKLTPKQ
jgi:hypothetical protein